MIVYRDIEGYEGKYQVSNTGVVIALNFHNQKYSKVLQVLKVFILKVLDKKEVGK